MPSSRGQLDGFLARRGQLLHQGLGVHFQSAVPGVRLAQEPGPTHQSDPPSVGSAHRQELPARRAPPGLRLRSFVNGEPRQDSSTADMVFSVAQLVHHLSQYLVLEPGDVINTGTPQGVALSGRFPYLATGDVMELSIDRLGTQQQTLGKA